MLSNKNGSCLCWHCKYYKPFEYQNEYFTVQKGFCEKHNSVRNPEDKLCDYFILKKGIYTKRWYPK